MSLRVASFTRPKRIHGVALAGMVLLSTGCHSYSVKTGRQIVPTGPISDSVVMTYLGTGGWLIEAGGEALLTGVHFSNPSPIRLFVSGLVVDTAMIESRLDPHRAALRRVRSILVGHGHYDHLMDVPYVASEFSPRATVYGSETVVNNVLGWSGIDTARLHVVDASAGNNVTPGTWITDPTGRFRFQPVKSKHSPHFVFFEGTALAAPVQLWTGERQVPHNSFPDRASDWVDGATYAYLIDVLDARGDPFFRIYYQDSGTTAPDGHPAPSTQRSQDSPMLAILTAPGHKWEESYPDSILSQLKPDYVLVSHWEDFLLRKADQTPTPTPLTYFGEFVKKMNGWNPTKWSVPAPMSRWVFQGR